MKGMRTRFPTGTLPVKNASSPNCTMLSPTEAVMSAALIGSVPPRKSSTSSSPLVSCLILSNSSSSPTLAVTVAVVL